jgi:hypothetical protein
MVDDVHLLHVGGVRKADACVVDTGKVVYLLYSASSVLNWQDRILRANELTELFQRPELA